MKLVHYCPDYVGVSSLFYCYTLPCLFHFLDPLDGLTLRVDHEGPSVAGGHNDAVFRGESVGGKALDVPVSNGRRFPQEMSKGEIRCARNVQVTHLVKERGRERGGGERVTKIVLY